MAALIHELFITRDDSIQHAAKVIDRTARGIALVVDGERRLLGTVVDGDIRRALLAGIGLETPVQWVLDRKRGSLYATPTTAPAATEPDTLRTLMREHQVRQLPLVDGEGAVVGLVTVEDLLGDTLPDGSILEPPEGVIAAPLGAVIMAGGYGIRLRPLTEDTPKPMLRVGGRPLMERIVERLARAGIRDIRITTHFQARKIVDHFGEGERFGVRLSYVHEEAPLGTVGALGLMPRPSCPQLVINGDILTSVDFRAMVDFHRVNEADLTMAVRPYEIQVPYGVVHCDGAVVRGIVEKPVQRFFVNAGIYVLEPSVYDLIRRGEPMNMTDLVDTMVGSGRTVISFPIREYWQDIGQHADYAKAEEDILNGKVA